MKVIVHAGSHSHFHCPVRVVLPISLKSTLCLREEETGQTVPCQTHTDTETSLAWILDALDAGATRTYAVVEAEHAEVARAVRLSDTGDKIAAAIGGQLFTCYNYGASYARPFLYPVIGPYGHSITRSYPMVDDAPGEKHDHPHHKSLYTAFGEVNGVDNWSETKGHGRIVHRRFSAIESGAVFGRIAAENDWLSNAGETVVTETREMILYDTPAKARLVDYAVTFHAGDESVTFGDTKEGGILSVRVATSMDVDSNLGGQITNAYGGIDEEETWGKPAPWCDYSGPVAGRTVGIAVLDHPDNLRHPTQWHVRNYGLMTANCFGWSYYRDDKSLDGSYTIPPRTDLTFKYRIYIHAGRAEHVSEQFTGFCFPPRVSVEG